VGLRRLSSTAVAKRIRRKQSGARTHRHHQGGEEAGGSCSCAKKWRKERMAGSGSYSRGRRGELEEGGGPGLSGAHRRPVARGDGTL
jgi:hypothetical protein